jgi:Flp pilus assembly protein TadG
MVEFAIVLPIFCLLLFGILQFGVVFHNYLALTDAVRAGARKAAVSRFEPDPVGTTTAAVQAAAVNLDEEDLTVDVSTSGGWVRGSDVTVTATYPYSVNLIGIVVKSGSLTSTTVERIE